MTRVVAFGALAIAILAGFAAWTPPALGYEPEGRIRFRTDGAAKPAEAVPGLDPDEQLIRLSVEGAVPLAGAVLVHSSPPGVAQRLVAVHSDKGSRMVDRAAGAQRNKIDLGTLVPGAPLVLDFAEVVAAGSGGVVVFTIQMPGPDGAVLWEESFGVVVGQVGPPAVLRNGALEFPAHELVETAP